MILHLSVQMVALVNRLELMDFRVNAPLITLAPSANRLWFQIFAIMTHYVQMVVRASRLVFMGLLANAHQII